MNKLILLFLFVSAGTFAQVPSEGERLERVDRFIQKYIDNERLNGAVIRIEKGNKVMLEKAYGYADVSSRQPMRTDHIFRIASMTKPIISVGVMMLYEEGLFALDDPISNFIPEFGDPEVIESFRINDTTYTTRKASREITIRDLLSHTSGIGYAQIGDEKANAVYYKHHINGGIGTPYTPLAEMIPKLASLPLMQDPGSGFLYGLNTDVLGYFIEVVSGQPLDVFLRERIFDPLDMSDTFFYLPESHHKRLVPLYKYEDNLLSKQDSLIDLFVTFHRDYPLYPDGAYFSGGAGLSSTAEDYMKFAQMLQNEGNSSKGRLLAANTLRMMHTNQIGDFLMWNDSSRIQRFGLGVGIYTDAAFRKYGMPSGSFGWAGMYASHLWIDPENDVTVVIMRNIWPTPDWDLFERIVPVIYQALPD